VRGGEVHRGIDLGIVAGLDVGDEVGDLVRLEELPSTVSASTAT
jgi:hypothetical protein